MTVIIVELLAFVLVVAVLWRFVKPLVAQLISDRQDQIQQQVDAATEATRKLTEAQRRFEYAEVEARKEVAKIRDDARADATRISEELREQADRDVERIRQRGQDQLVAQRDHLVRVLRAELGSQSLELAERVVRALLADEDRRSATVDHFLDDLDTLGDRAVSGAGASISQGGAS